MHVVYLAWFLKDLDKLKSSPNKKSILSSINRIKSANSINDIPDLKKPTGHRNVY